MEHEYVKCFDKFEVELKEGDIVVNTGSTPIKLHMPTNMIKINKVD
jgi:hypothetical protein